MQGTAELQSTPDLSVCLVHDAEWHDTVGAEDGM